ncbi:MAG: DUF4835 family protein [Balneolaceae bacterium]|nr:DUF4835 family protein [Balneolaceae bacterium]
MKYLKFNCLFLLWLFTSVVAAQEFDCQITVNDEQLEGNSFEYVSGSLTTDLEAYINEYRWTELEVLEQERIQCQISIILLQGDQDFNFAAETVIQSRRPIYNTLNETGMLILSDGAWGFNYPEGKSLIHDELEFEAMTGFIDYYMNLMLGYDFDSYSELGGTEYFQKAQNVVDLAQNESSIGWTRNSNNGRNRFVLISDILNNNYEVIRRANYEYHRLVLDTFVDNPNASRAKLLEILTVIQDAKRRATNNFLFDLFFDAKSKEIASILEDAEPDLKFEAYQILRDTDSAHLNDYEALQN